jgi:hypothetical protein
MVLIVQVDSIQDTTRQELLEVLKTGTHASALADLSKRKLIEKKKIYYFTVEKGDEFTRDIRKQETDISVEMLQKFTPHPSCTIVDWQRYADSVVVRDGRRRLLSLIISMQWEQFLASAPSIH